MTKPANYSGPKQGVYRAPAPAPIVNPNGHGKPLRPREGKGTLKAFPHSCGGVHSHILVSPEACAKMNTFIRCCSVEIGWLGVVEEIGDVLFISDVLLFDQEVSASQTEIDADALADFWEECLTNPPAGMTDLEVMEMLSKIRFWGHSHVNMGVFPSGTDERTMHVQFAQMIEDSEQRPWFVRAIGNKSGEMVFDVFYYNLGFSIRDMGWSVGTPAKAEEEDAILAEMTAKTRRSPPANNSWAAWANRQQPQSSRNLPVPVGANNAEFDDDDLRAMGIVVVGAEMLSAEEDWEDIALGYYGFT